MWSHMMQHIHLIHHPNPHRIIHHSQQRDKPKMDDLLVLDQVDLKKKRRKKKKINRKKKKAIKKKKRKRKQRVTQLDHGNEINDASTTTSAANFVDVFNDPASAFSLGLAHERQRNISMAQKYYTIAATNPTAPHPRALYHLGCLSNNPCESLRCLRLAVTLKSPVQAKAMVAVGNILMERGEEHNAFQLYVRREENKKR